jgi:ribonuclease HII
MNYYKQLLDSYDSKKMSAANRKFYNDLIKTANKQDGMVTEAQLRELDRLKSGNFDFGKRGYAKGGATNDYIEIDIPEEEIQKYIAQGYIVEPVSKLKKFIS